jgi:MinD superfamily P-loop ATPase
MDQITIEIKSKTGGGKTTMAFLLHKLLTSTLNMNNITIEDGDVNDSNEINFNKNYFEKLKLLSQKKIHIKTTHIQRE